MKQFLQEKEGDELLAKIVRSASATDETIASAAESSSVWWGVRRGMQAGKKRNPWPAPPKFVELLKLFIPVAVTAAILVAGSGYFLMTDRVASGPIAATYDKASDPVMPLVSPAVSAPVAAAPERAVPAMPPLRADLRSRSGTATTPSRAAMQRPHRSAPVTREIRTDFIALSYGARPESGQLVRLKVPQSMMVSLGLVPAVDHPGKMVDAEVIVGDDGLTQAIRFVRTSN